MIRCYCVHYLINNNVSDGAGNNEDNINIDIDNN